MNCQELDPFLHAYLDGEFAPAERQEVEQHLAGCPLCTHKLASEAHLQSLLRARMKGVAVGAPDRLRQNVRTGLRREQRRLQLASWARWGAAAALAAAASSAYFALRTPPRDRFIEDAALRHARHLPYEVQTASPAQLEAWFEGKLGYRVPLPTLSHVTPTGARLSNLREREAAYIGYQGAVSPSGMPSRVGLFVLDDSDQELPVPPWPELRVQEAHGYRVASWRSRGVVYELVSDLDEQALRGLLAPSPTPPSPSPAGFPPLTPVQRPAVLPASFGR